MEEIDCVVVGAGLYGLAAARQFRHIHPSSSLVILDGQSTIGGTWATERLYPGLKSNNLLGTYEYPLFPMSSDDFDVEPAEHIKGASIHEYLAAYADRFGLTRLVRLNRNVVSAEHRDADDEGGWLLTVAASSPDQQRDPPEEKILARKLIVATGTTSRPNLPRFPGQDEFQGDIWHVKDFAKNSHTLKTASSVTVYGGHKSAWDVVYEYASAGVKVDWVIRSSGSGPCWMSRPYATPLNLWMEKLATTRLITWFSPCIWGDADSYGLARRFLHGTAIGRFLVNAFWRTVAGDVLSSNAFDASPDTANLKPWSEDVMFVGDSLSILNYEKDMYKVMREAKVRVHLSEIQNLSKGAVYLADGTRLDSDLLIAATGWEHAPSIKFLPEGISAEMGIPSSSASQKPPHWQAQLDECDAEILEQFPRLRDQPTRTGGDKKLPGPDAPLAPQDPYMLHRFMVPASPRSLHWRDLAFAGMMSNTNNATSAHVCGLWIAAFLGGKIPLAAASDRSPRGASERKDDEAERKSAERRIQREAILHNRWGHWRYPVDWGNKRPSFVFDAVPYFDLLLRDMGLENRRKGNFITEMLTPYGPADYRGIEDEWLQLHKTA